MGMYTLDRCSLYVLILIVRDVDWGHGSEFQSSTLILTTPDVSHGFSRCSMSAGGHRTEVVRTHGWPTMKQEQPVTRNIPALGRLLTPFAF